MVKLLYDVSTYDNKPVVEDRGASLQFSAFLPMRYRGARPGGEPTVGGPLFGTQSKQHVITVYSILRTAKSDRADVIEAQL